MKKMNMNCKVEGIAASPSIALQLLPSAKDRQLAITYPKVIIKLFRDTSLPLISVGAISER